MTTPLVGRFERLLRVYPAGYRRAHGEDMLTTMLADAGEGRRWPRLGDAANLLFHGLRLRLVKRPPGAGLLDSGWADACSVIGALGAFVLMALRLAVLLRLPPWMPGPYDGGTVIASATNILQCALWGLAAVTALAGLRRVAAGLAWVALLAEVVPPVRDFAADPVPVVRGLWLLVLGLVAAVALSVAGRRGAWAVAGRRRLGTILAAIVVAGATAVLGGSGILVHGLDESGGYHVFYPADLIGFSETVDGLPGLEATSGAVLDLMLLTIAAALLAGAIALARMPGPVRRRILVAASPVVTMVAHIALGFNGWAVSNDNMGHAIPLVPGQWVALVVLPLLVFVLGLWWVRRRDETMRLAAIGAIIEQS
jgi:hypothetical protein